MAGKIIADTIQTEASFLQLNVSNTRIATMNASGIYSNTGGKIIGSDGTFGNSTIVNATVSSNLNFDSTGTTGFNTATANTVRVHTAGVERVRIDSSGNLGVGTTSPSAPLDVTGVIKSSTYSQYGSSMYYGIGNALSGTYASTDLLMYNGANGIAGFLTNNTERMRITSDGILVTGGATSAGGIDVGNSTNPGVAIYGTSSAKGIITVQNNNDSCMYMSKASGYTSGIYAKLYVNSSQVGKIETNGSTTSYVTTSDYRLKEDIAPLSGALNTVALLKPVTYKWKTTGDAGQGFIAHELQEVVPEAVSGAKDATETYTDEDGNEQTRIAPQGIDTSFLVATLTAAIQEQQAIISDLKARIEALEA